MNSLFIFSLSGCEKDHLLPDNPTQDALAARLKIRHNLICFVETSRRYKDNRTVPTSKKTKLIAKAAAQINAIKPYITYK